jgi:hypothetical protein
MLLGIQCRVLFVLEVLFEVHKDLNGAEMKYCVKGER